MSGPEADKQWFKKYFQQRLERLQQALRRIRREEDLQDPVLREDMASLLHKIGELPKAERQEFIDAIMKVVEDTDSVLMYKFITQGPESEAPISLYFDLDSLTPTDIADLMVFLSELYEDLGGDGLIIDDVTLLDFQPATVPVEG
jgi:hypothetical protein